MKISVIIPVYNAQNTIVRAIESVINQTVKPFEIIIINDGSTDKSKEIVEEFIRIINPQAINIKLINKENGGVSSARNQGFYHSKGSLFALLDSDDIWSPEKLERQLEILELNPEIDFLGCARNNEKLSILGKKIDSLHQSTVKELLIKMHPQTSTAIFKRKLYDDFGGYNEDMTHAEDGNLWIHYCSKSKFYYLPESLVITGEGKPSFGHSGLSANLRAMQLGNDFMLINAMKEKIISKSFFCLIYALSKVKYIRRLLIVKFR
jgi:glycosyltransferase involved in cell wall biosynthesis